MIESAKQKLKQVQSTVLSRKKKGEILTYNNLKIKGTNENYFTDKEVAELNKFGTLQELVILVDARYWGLEIKLKDRECI